jgi:hypothetical protein
MPASGGAGRLALLALLSRQCLPFFGKPRENNALAPGWRKEAGFEAGM